MNSDLLVAAAQYLRMSTEHQHVARKTRCDVSYVSRVARGERRSAKVEAELDREFRFALRKLKLDIVPKRSSDPVPPNLPFHPARTENANARPVIQL